MQITIFVIIAIALITIFLTYTNKTIDRYNGNIPKPSQTKTEYINYNTTDTQQTEIISETTLQDINDFNNIQQNRRFEDLIYYQKKILFWIRLIGLFFVIIPVLAILLAIIFSSAAYSIL